jgi:hypothetical protein
MKKFIPIGSEFILIKKFPIMEVRSIAKLECNNDNARNEKENEAIIQASKNLRLMLKIDEKKICFKCSKKNTCKFFEKLPSSLAEAKGKEQKIGSILDLQTVLHGFYLNTQKKVSHTLISNNEVTKNNMEKSDIEIETTLKRIGNKDWNSANLLMVLLNESLEDLMYNKGIELKTLINSVIESQKDEAELLSKEEADKLKLNSKESDPYVKLLNDLKNCKNRGEKRRLLARFNKKVGFGWGEYRKVINDKMDDNNEEDEDKKKNSMVTAKAPFREEGSIYNNTAFISQNNMKNIIGTQNQKRLASSHFSQKINMKNAKFKQIKGQESLSLLMNESREGKISEEKTYVKIPGADYTKAIDYLNKKGQDSKEFINQVAEKRDNNSVDIRKSINVKLNKVDLKMEKSKQFTLKKQIESQQIKSNEIITNQHKLAFSEFENKLIGETKNETYFPNTDVKEEENKIEFYRQSNKSNDSSMEFYKQTNITAREKCIEGQEKSKIKKIIKNKHIYKAHNYYNNTNLEHLPFEKDADFSRAMQFAKSIKKDPKPIDK